MKNISYLKQNGVDVDSSVELFGDIGTYNETMKDFLEGINSKLERLSSSKENNNFADYGIFAHSIKSDARYLGFTTVAQTALNHENAGKESNQKFITDDYNNLINMVNNMIMVVKEYLNGEEVLIVDNTPVNVTSKKKILILDDSVLITNLINNSLKDYYDLVIYNNPIDAKSYLEENVPLDAILLDLNMPMISGFEILDLLKEKNYFSKTKVSIITGDESEDVIARAFTYPIIDMLQKPFGVEELKRVVDKTLNLN